MSRKKGGIKAADLSPEFNNAAKTLLANIRFSSIDTQIKSIVVTSSVPNEGKSTVAGSLANAIATSGKNVLLVDCDLHNPTLAHRLNLQGAQGIYSVLTYQVQPVEAVQPTSQPNMYFLGSEPGIPNPADVFASKRFAKFLEALEEAYDYVVIDTPPVGTFVDAAILGNLADATVFVVRENHVRRSQMIAAYDQLAKADVNVIGAVLNCCEDDDSMSSYYYYEYYTRDGRKNASSAR
jgi:capsular exopolysaccharide synthesis family protein